ncbi:MAG TPA: aminotransferase class I/II-fold pyridoxal phosphate-dependent enzyme, partial [Alphaproteobacteria bacterium]|nr:aminotransferase class I/II-fold pyridoxal phosphate-dependent enzyme [Alphaproteobacteria bacterium]
MAGSLEEFARAKLAALEDATLRRRLAPTARAPGAAARRGPREMISFCDNDYLGLSQHPALKEAAIQATEKYGAGAGASRLVTGDNPLYEAVETRIARIKGTEAAIVFGSGYLANIGIIPALIGADDLIIADELIHACMHAGARLSRAKTRFFRHNDAAHAAEILAEERGNARHCLVLTEGVFSMDGDRAPVAALAEAARDFDAWLLVDDAHALGVINQGRGSGFADGAQIAVDLQMGTLSKAVGAYGGYLAASKPVIDLMVNRARSLIYTTGLPPGVLAAADKGLELIETDRSLTALPLARARAFTDALCLPRAESAVVPLILEDESRALDAARALSEQG